MTIVPVAEWVPDMPDIPGVGSATIFNVIPKTPMSYGPFPGLTTISSALTARCQGGTGFQDKSGNNYVFAGDATHLYKLSPGSVTFSDVSKAANYTTGATERWQFAVYGERVIATNFTDPIQSFLVGTDTLFSNLAAAAPQARRIGIIKDFVFVGNTTDGVDGAVPGRVWWCAIDDPTNWPTPGTSAAAAAQSDNQDLFDMGGVQGIVGGLGAADGAIVMERGIVRVNYVGTPSIFTFFPAQGARGTNAPGSIALIGAAFFYLAEDGLALYDGATSTPVGLNKFNQTLFADLDTSAYHLITSAVDPTRQLYLMAYPGADHPANACNRILAYHYGIGRATITVANDIQCEQLLRTFSLGYDLEGLDSVSSSIDALTESLDSRIWTGGRPNLTAFNTSHKMGYLAGANLAATVDTSSASLFDGKRGRLNRLRPIVYNATASVAVGVKDLASADPVFGTAVAVNTTGDCPVRADGRFHTGRITIAAGAGDFEISGVEIVDAVPLGSR